MLTCSECLYSATWLLCSSTWWNFWSFDLPFKTLNSQLEKPMWKCLSAFKFNYLKLICPLCLHVFKYHQLQHTAFFPEGISVSFLIQRKHCSCVINEIVFCRTFASFVAEFGICTRWMKQELQKEKVLR